MPRHKQFTAKELKKRQRAQKTASELRRRREAQGRDPLMPPGAYKRGEYNARAKLTARKVKMARELWDDGNGLTMRTLAKKFQVSYSTMHDALKGITWKSASE
jgi:hypothetical protein